MSVHLTPAERLLLLGLRIAPEGASLEDLARALGYSEPYAPSTLIRAHISNMRRKGLEISPVRGWGYRLGKPGRIFNLWRCRECNVLAKGFGDRRHAAVEDAYTKGWTGGQAKLCPECSATRKARLELQRRSLAEWRARNKEERERRSA